MRIRQSLQRVLGRGQEHVPPLARPPREQSLAAKDKTPSATAVAAAAPELSASPPAPQAALPQPDLPCDPGRERRLHANTAAANARLEKLQHTLDSFRQKLDHAEERAREDALALADAREEAAAAQALAVAQTTLAEQWAAKASQADVRATVAGMQHLFVNAALIVRGMVPGLRTRTILSRMLGKNPEKALGPLAIRCGLFDPAWYQSQYPDSQSSGLSPWIDYLKHGAPQGRLPSPQLHTGLYSLLYLPSETKLVNPVLHFFAHMPAVLATKVNPLLYLLVDPVWYLKTHKDVAEFGMDPILHYCLHGSKEGRDPGPFFQTSAYLERHPDCDPHKTLPILHFLAHATDEEKARLQYVSA